MTQTCTPPRAGTFCLTRRRFMEGAVTVATTSSIMMPLTSLADNEKAVAELKAQGYEAHPCACNVCGGYCGLLLMHQKGAPYSEQTVRIMPNPTHPQRGCCARGAQAVYAWNHPLRLAKPMKRIGDRGQGKFETIEWDQALDEIAQKVRTLTAESGEHTIAMTSHNFSDFQKWFGYALGTPNVISHSSTCNSASIMGRRMVFGKGFDGAGKVEPDYENCRYLLCLGRTLNCAIGVASVFAKARARGAQLVFVDPRMPEGALGNAQWVPIRPGTDGALILAMLNVAIEEKLVNFDFLRNYTNAAYLLKKGTFEPQLAKDYIKGAPDGHWLVMDMKRRQLRAVGLRRDDKGQAIGFDEPDDLVADISYEGHQTKLDGTDMVLESCYAALKRDIDAMTPQAASKLTGIDEPTIYQLARDFFTLGGVCDDGWYASRNGNDSHTFALMCLLNVFNGHLDQKGGFIVTQGAGYKGPGVSLKGTKATGPMGQTWTIPDGQALDKVYYPEGSGTFSAIFDAIHSKEPYPVRGVFITGSTMFHREANSARLVDALNALELVVVQDILPHEIIDYADYVLPSTMFLEWQEYTGVKWARDGYLQKNEATMPVPDGIDARDEIWQFCEILLRAYPERAKERLGYTKTLSTREEFLAWYRPQIEAKYQAYIASQNQKNAGAGTAIDRAIQKDGWALVKQKTYGVYPYQKPFGTTTGKAELVSFAMVKYLGRDFSPLASYNYEIAYSLPKPQSDEFFLVSGKDSSSCSGVSLFTWPTKFMGDRTLWMNPVDALRLKVADGDVVELQSLDTGVRGRAQVTLTHRVIAGSLFSYGFSGGSRARLVGQDYAFVREGINSHWFATGTQEPVVGALANNASVRVKRVGSAQDTYQLMSDFNMSDATRKIVDTDEDFSTETEVNHG